MKTFQLNKILVPIDFSALSLNALHHAVKLAQRTKAKITLLYVVQPYVDLFNEGGVMLAASKLENEVLTESERRLTNLAETTKKRTKVHIDTKVILGVIDTTITKTASKIKADLIIMGTHGTNGFFDDILGSNTYQVAALSKIPVLSVHKQIKRTGYTHLVYPVREETHYMEKLPYALAFAWLFKARVDIVGFVRAGQKKQGESMRQRCQELKEKFEHFRIPAKTVFTSNEYFAAETISYAYPNSLVIIIQDRDFGLVDLFRKSFTKGVLHKALAPVLTVPSRIKQRRRKH